MIFVRVLLLLFIAENAQAASDSVCEFYKKNLPKLYKVICAGNPRKSRMAGSNSTFADSFNINSAAALPNGQTPYGLETIGSYIRSDTGLRTAHFSFIKGFKKIGTGVTTSGSNTFYSNDLLQRLRGEPNLKTFDPIETPKGHFTHLNFGTAFKLRESQRYTLMMGLTARYNNTTSTIGGGGAFALNRGRVTLGIGGTQEKVSNLLPAVRFVNALGSVRVAFFELEYIFMKNTGHYGLSPIHVLTLNATLGRLLLSVAARRLDYAREDFVTQKHISVQYLVAPRVSLGYLYNYIPGANSLALQLFL